jgi:hypothetical protein
MTEERTNDRDDLMAEIVRYLAVVDAFRAANCEPSWRPEHPFTGSPGGAAAPAASSRIAH